MECGVGEIELRDLCDGLLVEAGDLGGDREIVDELEVLGAHFARRSNCRLGHGP
jgi:hypothetical protein